MQHSSDLEGMGCGSHLYCSDPKKKEKNTKILLCNLEVSLFSCLRSFPSGPQGIPQNPTVLPDFCGERNASEYRQTEI